MVLFKTLLEVKKVPYILGSSSVSNNKPVPVTLAQLKSEEKKPIAFLYPDSSAVTDVYL
jgi:hypothetical protein